MLEHHHPRLALACSFQKEEAVLIDMLLELEPAARVFTIDTGVLFPETYEAWRAARGPLRRARRGLRRRARRASPGRVEPLLRGAQGRRARARARRALDAWITGLRREQAPTRSADAEARPTTTRRGIWKANPLADWTEQDVWDYIRPPRPPLQRTARPRLRLDRLRPVHPSRLRPRGALGRQRQDRVRHPRLRPRCRIDTTAASLRALASARRSRPRRCMSCGRWRRVLSGRCCCSAAARTRLCCCGWRRRRFARRAFRSR